MSNSRELKVVIQDDGSLLFVHDDALICLEALGTEVLTARASHVEPAPSPSLGDGVVPTTSGWTADMAPSGGPVLGPFGTRQAALAAERDWLREHRGL